MENQEIETPGIVLLKNFLRWGIEKYSVARIGLEVKEKFLNLRDITSLYANGSSPSKPRERMI